jgi:hypothetical protein
MRRVPNVPRSLDPVINSPQKLQEEVLNLFGGTTGI